MLYVNLLPRLLGQPKCAKKGTQEAERRLLRTFGPDLDPNNDL